MHTTVFEGLLVHYNGDFSGDVIITVPADAVSLARYDDTAREVSLPFDVLKAVVAEWKRVDLIRALEDADDDAVLKEWQT